MSEIPAEIEETIQRTERKLSDQLPPGLSMRLDRTPILISEIELVDCGPAPDGIGTIEAV